VNQFDEFPLMVYDREEGLGYNLILILSFENLQFTTSTFKTKCVLAHPDEKHRYVSIYYHRFHYLWVAKVRNVPFCFLH
jgi:hypothetical protein